MDIVQWFPNERVDIGDLAAATKAPFYDSIRMGRILWKKDTDASGQAATTARIFDNFTVSNYTSYARVYRGKAIMNYWDDGELKYGLIVGEEGPTYQDIDVTSMGDGTYGIYVRGVLDDDSYSNRVFWNPSGSPAVEYLDNVPTRLASSWQVATQLTSAPAPPGNGEYMKIYEITVASGAITGITDLRHFFFEGSVPDSYAQEWGTALDRSTTRTQFGVETMHEWIQAVRRQLADILGGNWFDEAGISLAALDDEHKTTGEHNEINAESIKCKDTTSSQLFYADNWIAKFTELNRDTPVHAVETCGRIAHPHRFYDDFAYNADKWTSYNTGLPEPYTSGAGGTGPGDVDAGSKSDYSHGGIALFSLSAAPDDFAVLSGPLILAPDPDCSSPSLKWRFFARLGHSADSENTKRFSIGIYAGSSYWAFYFDYDVVGNGNSNWWIKAYQGGLAGGPNTWAADCGVGIQWTTPPGDLLPTYQSLYIGKVSNTSIQWCIIDNQGPYSTVGTLTHGDVTGVRRPMGCWAYAIKTGADTDSSQSYLDCWEVWDNEAVGQDLGASS